MENEFSESVFEHNRNPQAVDLAGALALHAANTLEELSAGVSSSTIQLVDGLISENPLLEVRQEQIECWDALYDARESGKQTALIHMATGLGKTTVVAADAKRFVEDNPDARVLFLCHQNDILSQARERFEKILGPDHTYGSFTGRSQDYHEVTCLFASLQVMSSWREAFFPDEFDYVVVDESHHGKAPTYEPTLRYFQPQFMVGITGTPDRHDLQDIREIFGAEIYRLPLEEALARGLLAQVDYHVITDGIIDSNQLYDESGKRLNIKQLNETLFIPQRDEEMARIIQEHSEKLDGSPRRIIFCNSIEETEEFAQYFDHAAPLHSDLPHWEQDKYLEQFRKNELDTLLTVDKFNEGIDIPDANQIVFRRSTQSKTVFLQQLGRGLRKIPGKDSVQVLDFVANCDRLVMIDEVWKEIELSVGEGEPQQVNEVMRLNVGDIHFTAVTRDIMEILSDIETELELTRQLRSEGWLSLKGTAEQLGVSTNFLNDYLERIGVEPVAIPSGKRGTYKLFSPTDQQKITDWFTSVFQPPEDGYQTVYNLATEVGWGVGRMTNFMEESGIEPRLYRSPASGKLLKYLAPEQIQAIKARIDTVELVPDSYMPRYLLAKKVGVATTTLTDILKSAGIEPSEYIGKRGKLGKYLSPAEISQLYEFMKLPGSPGQPALKQESEYISINRLAENTGAANVTINRIIQELGISPTQMRDSRHQKIKGLSADDVAKIKNYLILRDQQAPEGYLTVSMLQEVTGLSETKLERLVSETGEKWERYRDRDGRRRLVRHLSPAAVQKILEHGFTQTQIAPQDYTTAHALSNSIGFADVTIKRAAKKLGITPAHYRSVQGNIYPHYSPEEANTIKEYLKRNIP